MATTNVALKRPITANSSISPYAPSRVVDGDITAPASRWLTNKLPGWLQVNLGSRIYVDRWVVRHLSSAGWNAKYCLPTYSLQLSQDGVNWIMVDSVAGNTAPFTDRSFPATCAIYARVVVNSAMPVNTALASLLEFELYNAATTSGKLASLTFSSGALVPLFSSTVVSYTQQVGFSTNALTVTAIPEDSLAAVTVNGIGVVNGQPSTPVALNVGCNTITVAVTPVIGPVNNYVTTVTRADSCYLSSLTVKAGPTALKLVPNFASTTLSYTVGAGSANTVSVFPVAQSTSASVTVNGIAITPTIKSISVTLSGTSTLAEIKVTNGGITTTYQVMIAKP